MNHFGTSQWLVIVSTRFESLQRRPLKFTAARNPARKYLMVPGMSVMAVSTRFVSLQRHPLKIHSGGELSDGSLFCVMVPCGSEVYPGNWEPSPPRVGTITRAIFLATSHGNGTITRVIFVHKDNDVIVPTSGGVRR